MFIKVRDNCSLKFLRVTHNSPPPPIVHTSSVPQSNQYKSVVYVTNYVLVTISPSVHQSKYSPTVAYFFLIHIKRNHLAHWENFRVISICERDYIQPYRKSSAFMKSQTPAVHDMSLPSLGCSKIESAQNSSFRGSRPKEVKNAWAARYILLGS